MTFLRRLDDRVLPTVAGVLKQPARHKVVVGALVIGLAAAVFVVVATTHRGQTEKSPAARSVTKVGPVDGMAIAGYLARTRSELAGLSAAGDTPVYALVSLTGYGTPAQLARLSDGYPVSRAFFRVPLVGMQTEIQPADGSDLRRDLETQMRQAGARADNDAKDAEAQASRLTGSSAQERQLNAFYTASARQLRVAAREYLSLCACVFSLVVKATPQGLTTLTRRAGVRAVDPAPEVSSLGRAVFLPLLPEQATTVAPPADAGLPPLPTPSPAHP